jgi:TatA/E family protein of Tat protein translocase
VKCDDAIPLLVFGAQRLPGIARSIGGSVQGFKKGIKEVEGVRLGG